MYQVAGYIIKERSLNLSWSQNYSLTGIISAYLTGLLWGIRWDSIGELCVNYKTLCKGQELFLLKYSL